MNDADLARLRWRARRGLLENDLILGRFLAAHATTLSTPAVLALGQLLELPDNDLLDLLLKRAELSGAADTPEIRAVLAALRSA